MVKFEHVKVELGQKVIASLLKKVQFKQVRGWIWVGVD